jgi:hypothetical protein
MSEFDDRQYLAMRERIEGFDRGTLTLRRLIADLDALLESLQEVDENWKSSFQQQWGTLEDVYAVSLDKRSGQLTANDRQLIAQAAEKMRQLLPK